ncbi:hypothetical protein ABMA28_012784 [Loxostege sticticalis]|uniref:Serine-threonine/tyrosine-protein kinase catalytic domain-containing protein n=1 Tax=Loxostege sticticalis TaxID=481309 RepID=A0ABD0S4V0_LOXSC
MLETMRRCWSGAPELRPSAAALVSALSAPEYPALCDAAAAAAARAAAAAPLLLQPRPNAEECDGGWEVWYGGEPERAHSLLVTRTRFTHHHTLRVPPGSYSIFYISR